MKVLSLILALGALAVAAPAELEERDAQPGGGWGKKCPSTFVFITSTNQKQSC